MQRYIGTKIIQAEPCYGLHGKPVLVDSASLKDGEVLMPGYKVVYEDGYISWSPKDVFEKAYHLDQGLDFGDALRALKAHHRVARAGWNGKDQYVTLIPAGNAMFQGYDMQDCFGLKNAQNKMQPGWVPSIGDCMATDWRIVE
jgi:hypothetical protein